MYFTVGIQQTSTSEFKDLHQIYGLIPTSRPVIAPPAPQLKFEDVPGGSGSLDLSQVLSNEINYYDRSGSLEFMLAPDANNGGEDIKWEEVYSELVNFLGTGRVRLWTSENAWGEPVFSSYYYEGRMTVSDWQTDKSWEKVTLDYRFDPYKYANDPFVSELYSVSDPLTLDLAALHVTSDVTHTIVPTITLSTRMKVTYDGREYNLPSGSSRMIAFSPGVNTIKFEITSSTREETRTLAVASGTSHLDYQLSYGHAYTFENGTSGSLDIYSLTASSTTPTVTIATDLAANGTVAYSPTEGMDGLALQVVADGLGSLIITDVGPDTGTAMFSYRRSFL